MLQLQLSEAGESGKKHPLEMLWIEPRTSHMQSACSSSELHPLDICWQKTLSSHDKSMTSTVLLSLSAQAPSAESST